MDEEAIQKLGSAKELQLPAAFHAKVMHRANQFQEKKFSNKRPALSFLRTQKQQ